jgi:gluconokinase
VRVVVMGVSGCGKSLVGARLAMRIAAPFLDADDFHSAANKAKMTGGRPLTDEDRAAWLDALAEALAARRAVVLACSALKRRYRDRLRAAAPNLRFVHLHGDFMLIRQRLSERQAHFFAGEAMLRSQFADLKPRPMTRTRRLSASTPTPRR